MKIAPPLLSLVALVLAVAPLATVGAADASVASGNPKDAATAAADKGDVHSRILDRTWAHGADVSHHQEVVDWARVSAAGVTFAFAKATEGTDWQDPQFLPNWTGMKAAGILRGAYHMLRPEDEAGPQAEWFLSVLRKAGFGPGDLPPVLDVERVSGVDKVPRPLIAERALQWLRIVEERLGVRPLLYTNPSFWKDYLEEDHPLTDYPLWLADYSAARPPELEHGWETWSFWQYRQDGLLDGIAETVDLNVFQGPPDAVKKVRP